MKINVTLYNKNNKVVGHRHGIRANWKKLYGKLASAVAHKWYIKVDYGYGRDVWGKQEKFINEGVYYNLLEAKKALSAFMEK